MEQAKKRVGGQLTRPVKLVPVSSLIPTLPEPVRNAIAIPDCPVTLTGSRKKSWAMFAKILHDAGVLTVSDGPALLRMVQAWEEIQECEQHIKEYGRVHEITDMGGNRRFCANPSVMMAAQADRRLRAYLLDFGLTPSARRYIVPQEGNDTDEPYNPLAEFM
jgi:P27 family predicted phage terminase small subunit